VGKNEPSRYWSDLREHQSKKTGEKEGTFESLVEGGADAFAIANFVFPQMLHRSKVLFVRTASKQEALQSSCFDALVGRSSILTAMNFPESTSMALCKHLREDEVRNGKRISSFIRLTFKSDVLKKGPDE
jgi:hypothetical protein